MGYAAFVLGYLLFTGGAFIGVRRRLDQDPDSGIARFLKKASERGWIAGGTGGLIWLGGLALALYEGYRVAQQEGLIGPFYMMAILVGVFGAMLGSAGIAD